LPQNDTNIYNTAVVFDRNGTVISTYRKYYLFNERGIRRPLLRDEAIFRTDFNVVFALYTGFDMLFTDVRRVTSNVVRNVVLPSRWYSELPFLTAVQFQQSWASANNVNLLAAGLNMPSNGNTGSGIYSGRFGPLRTLITETPTVSTLTAQVPIEPGLATIVVNQPSNSEADTESTRQAAANDLRLSRENLNEYNVAHLNFAQNTTQNGTLCHGEFCCTYYIEVEARPATQNVVSYSYAVAVFNGRRPFNTVPSQWHAGLQICSVVACTEGGSTRTCGLRFNRDSLVQQDRYTFNTINLSARFQNAPHIVTMPNTLNSALLSINPNDLSYTGNQVPGQINMTEISLRLLRRRSDILTFSIFGRDFSRDIGSSGNKVITGVIVIALSAVFSILY